MTFAMHNHVTSNNNALDRRPRPTTERRNLWGQKFRTRSNCKLQGAAKLTRDMANDSDRC